jgi:hypothetical protein
MRCPLGRLASDPSRLGRRARCFATAACLLFAARADASDSYYLDWIVGTGGIVVADADDRFFVRRDFLNSSQQNMSWTTDASELVFEVGPNHAFAVPGANRGPVSSGLSHNFAWGILRLAAGQHLVLYDANATPGAAQYVRKLILAGGLPQIADVSSDGTYIYYDRAQPENAYLAGQSYALSGGGAIAPFPDVHVPALGSTGAVTLAAAIAGIGSAAARRTAVRSKP